MAVKSINNQEASVSTPKTIEKPKKRLNLMCLRCGAVHDKQPGNFLKVRSTFYGANDGFLPVCNKCVDELFEHYRAVLDNNILRCIYILCLNFNLYFSKAIYESATKLPNFDNSPFNAYLSVAGLPRYKKWTDFTDTIDEEAILSKEDV